MKTTSLFIFLQLLILSFPPQIQFVGPVGPILQKLMPKNISVPASSIIEQDEFHLIMEYKVSTPVFCCHTGYHRYIGVSLSFWVPQVHWCFIIILGATGTLVFHYHSGCHRYIGVSLSFWVPQVHWCFIIILGATGTLVFHYHSGCHRYIGVSLSFWVPQVH